MRRVNRRGAVHTNTAVAVHVAEWKELEKGRGSRGLIAGNSKEMACAERWGCFCFNHNSSRVSQGSAHMPTMTGSCPSEVWGAGIARDKGGLDPRGNRVG